VTVADALMLALGVIAVGSGALVVTSTHLVRAGLYLVVSLGAIAGLYLVLGAELVAWVQVLVYVGAVVVLLLFAVMLTRAPIGPSRDLDRPAAPAALIGAGVGAGLTALLADAFRWTRFELPPTGNAERVGGQVFGGWVLPFEVLSILLLAALVGAIVLSRPDLGARPDPEAAAHPAGPSPNPVDESAQVVARLERIAARQAAAQARVRQTRAEQVAAEARAAAPAPAPAPGPPDPLKEQARDVVFGAHAARPRLGTQPPEEDDQRVIEGTARESATGPRRRPVSGPQAGEKRAVSGGEKRAVSGGDKPAVSGGDKRALSGPDKKDGDRPVLPPGATGSGEDA
jgi:NADH:ubiquinone oxidoreductase subunit 6 (subunit J)